MFENCTSLSELNAERIKLSSSTNIVELNNAYNEARAKIINSRNHYVKLNPILPKLEPVTKYCGVPVVGRSTEEGFIMLTEKGFLF